MPDRLPGRLRRDENAPRGVTVAVRLVAAALAAAACLAVSCIASFNDVPRPGCDGGSCVDATPPRPDRGVDARVDAGDKRDAGVEAGSCRGVADGGLCGPGDSCHDPPMCAAGVCAPKEKADGTPCGIPLDSCHSIPACKAGKCGDSTALADGTQWMAGDDNARCCGGLAVETTSVDNCGVCTIKCNTSLGQKCTAVDGHYFCTPCTATQCWSGCCSDTDSPSGHCSPSDCATGDCQSPDICPDGSHCQADVVNYCSY